MCNTIGSIFRLCIVAGCCLGLAMHFYVTFNCSFITTANGNNYGIWYVDDGTGNCVEWEEGTTDSYAKGAQSALTIATIAGFTAGVLVTFEWLICEVCCAGCVEGLAFACAWLSGGAVFTIYGIPQCGDFENLDATAVADVTADGEGGCQWGSDATLMTVANVAFLVAGIVLCCAPQPDPICKK